MPVRKGAAIAAWAAVIGRDMRIRICYLSSANAARDVVNSLHQMDGYTWRVVRVAPLEHPFGEDEVMYLSVPVFFRVELERVG